MGSVAELYQICATSEEKDLGIIFSQDLKFIHKITQSTNTVLGVIYCTFKYRDSSIIHHLYTSLVCPYLDCAINIWNSYLTCKLLENTKESDKIHFIFPRPYLS